MNEILLRELGREDAPAVAAIQKKCFDKRDAWGKRYFERVAWSDQSLFLVAELDGKIVAVAGATLKFEEESGFEIVTVAVDPAYHSQGVGTKIFAELIARLQEHGAKVLILEVRPSNTPAIEFYEHFGFKDMGGLSNFYHNEDALVMMRYL